MTVDPSLLVALGALAVALIALATSALLARRLRRLQADQRAVLGDHEQADLVTYARRMSGEVDEVSGRQDRLGDELRRRLEAVEGALQSAISHAGVVHYDAYNELSGRQSSSVALLDGRRSGIVLSSILHRDQARVYAKLVVEGRAEAELSPEEEQALRHALEQRPAASASG